MTKFLLAFVTIGFVTLFDSTVHAQHPQMPAGMTHEEHLAQLEHDAELKARGTAAMGFDQESARHHFLLYEDGGVIEVRATRADDALTRMAVRSHLQAIAREFAGGVFDKPLATHAETPAGVPTLRDYRTSLSYSYEETPDGGRVRIATLDATALAAVHAFLRYQIVEHKTGDPLAPRKQ